MNPLITLAGSAVVIAFMLGVAVLLGFRHKAQIADAAGLGELLANYEPGARIDVAAIDSNGRAALAKLTDGRLLAARVMADGVSLRIVPASAVALQFGEGKVTARFADLGFPVLKYESDRAAGLAP